MTLLTESALRSRALSVLGTRSARTVLTEQAKEFRFTGYDLFLSHRYVDAVAIVGLKDILIGLGYSVYVDWIDDAQLDRSKVNRATADLLRNRMKMCRALLFAVSSSSETSIWMPWELGYVDGKSGKVGVVPVVQSIEYNFNGQEYLQLYPHIDQLQGFYYVNDAGKTPQLLSSWLPLQK